METKCEPHCYDLITSSFSDGFLNHLKLIEAFLICRDTYVSIECLCIILVASLYQVFFKASSPFGELAKA